MPQCTATVDGRQCLVNYATPKGDSVNKLCHHHKQKEKPCSATTREGKPCSRTYDTPQGDAVNKLCWQHAASKVKKPVVRKLVLDDVPTEKKSEKKVDASSDAKHDASSDAGSDTDSDSEDEKESPLFLGVRGPKPETYIRNSVGTAKDKRRPTTWIAFYKQHVPCGVSTCAVENCDAVGTDGSHVELHGVKDRQYIVPLCRAHNLMSHKACARKLPCTLFLEPVGSRVRHMLLKPDTKMVRITPYKPAKVRK